MTASFRFSKTRQNGPFLAFLILRLSIQNVNVARFARNVEWDFFCDFQTESLAKYIILDNHKIHRNDSVTIHTGRANDNWLVKPMWEEKEKLYIPQLRPIIDFVSFPNSGRCNSELKKLQNLTFPFLVITLQLHLLTWLLQAAKKWAEKSRITLRKKEIRFFT